jgi:hypothetical protein
LPLKAIIVGKRVNTEFDLSLYLPYNVLEIINVIEIQVKGKSELRGLPYLLLAGGPAHLNCRKAALDPVQPVVYSQQLAIMPAVAIGNDQYAGILGLDFPGSDAADLKIMQEFKEEST